MRKTEHEHDFRHFSFRYSRLDFRVRWRFLEEIATSMHRFRCAAEGEMRLSGTGVNVPLQCVSNVAFSWGRATWRTCFQGISTRIALQLFRGDFGAASGDRTLKPPLPSVTYRNYITMVAVNAMVADDHCTLLHAGPRKFSAATEFSIPLFGVRSDRVNCTPMLASESGSHSSQYISRDS